MSALLIRPVQRILQAIDIGEIRNRGREYMTNDRREKTQHEQAQWFQKVYLPEHAAGNMFAFVGYMDAEPAAYGMVRYQGGHYWVTGVIHPDHHGKGYGEELFRFLTDFALYRHDHAMLEVLKSNTKAQKLYAKLGYEKVSEDGDKLVMRLGGLGGAA